MNDWPIIPITPLISGAFAVSMINLNKQYYLKVTIFILSSVGVLFT